MKSNRTELALIARGIDNDLAKQLRIQGFYLKSLRLMAAEELMRIGLSEADVASIQDGTRPPIPKPDLIKVLFANRWLCCVCRDPDKPIVVHHIRPWAQSGDHSPANLAVLCSFHHGEAHTTRDLNMTLSSDRLADFKARWETEVQRLDRHALHKATQSQGCHWWYFNHLRLYELAEERGVTFSRLPGYVENLEAGTCDKYGRAVRNANGDLMYESAGAPYLYFYMTQMLRRVLDRCVVRNVSDDLDRGNLSVWIEENDLILLQGRHSFSNHGTATLRSDPVLGKRSVNNVEIRFVFDRNEGTSVSARSEWLSGTLDVACLIQVKRMERVKPKVVITGTVLAIRNSHPDIKKRGYDANLYKSGLAGMMWSDEEEDIDEDIDEPTEPDLFT
ncbi:HNH endonuclease signature motif containing protein [Pseudomonas sp. NPDC089741]|uniref:HNH endonuclease signature motif containing protein n=1 Tax=Pseudomonas sp. NPDC089741 TaxID=3364470 RepID=UPI00380E3E87